MSDSRTKHPAHEIDLAAPTNHECSLSSLANHAKNGVTNFRDETNRNQKDRSELTGLRDYIRFPMDPLR